MVENQSLSDVVSSVTQPFANAEHEKAMQAFQAEIQYHRKHDSNGSYLERAVGYVFDQSASSLRELEFSYKIEKDNPNSSSREEVIKAVREDQKAIGRQDFDAHLLTSASAMALTALGGSWGKLAAAATVALDSTHPNDSLGGQALEAVAGFGSGRFAARLYERGLGMSNGFVGLPLSALAFPVFMGIGRQSWPNAGIGERPNPESIYSASVPRPNQSPFSSLQPIATPEWSNFDVMKK